MSKDDFKRASWHQEIIDAIAFSRPEDLRADKMTFSLMMLDMFVEMAEKIKKEGERMPQSVHSPFMAAQEARTCLDRYRSGSVEPAPKSEGGE